MSRKLWLTLLLGFTTNIAQAFDLEIALSGESANLEVKTESERYGFSGSDLSASIFFNEDDDFALSAGVLVDGTPAGDQPLTFGLGGKIYYINLDDLNADSTALALGFGVTYHIPGSMPIAIGGDAYIAPDVTAFGDGEEVMDVRLKLEVGILPNASAFIGYRQFEIDLKDGEDYELDENGHAGISFQF